MSGDQLLGNALQVLLRRLSISLENDPELRTAVGDLARALAEAVDSTSESTPRAAAAANGAEPPSDDSAAEQLEVAATKAAAQKAAAERRSTDPALKPLPIDVAIKSLNIGSQAPAEEPPPQPAHPRGAPPSDEDFPEIETRTRLKCEAARWAAERQRRLASQADYATAIAPNDRDIIARAKALPSCYLWMNTASFVPPADLSLCDQLADCFETLSQAVGLMRSVIERGAPKHIFPRALAMLAEAQSALRAAIQEVGEYNDEDQLRVYNWLRITTARESVYIDRHMRADDRASPSLSADRQQRIAALRVEVEQSQQSGKRQQQRLKRIDYHLKLLRENTAVQPEHDWNVVLETIDEMVADGVPPSNVELRELVMPMHDAISRREDLPVNVQRVLQEIDEFIASRSGDEVPQEVRDARAFSPEVERVAALLRGRAMVLIGGVPRPKSRELLREAFGLKELIWLETREHQSIEPFQFDIGRPDVALVILAIRWSSHSFGDAKAFCDAHNKPLVRLPAGYSPNQVASQILLQCSERLESLARVG